jgi:hypothetical protein
MPKIIFQFHGGALDGRSLEGDDRRSLSTAYFDPVLRHWFGTHFGTTGRRFMMPGSSGSSEPSVYEVIGRTDEEHRIVVEARHVTDTDLAASSS